MPQFSLAGMLRRRAEDAIAAGDAARDRRDWRRAARHYRAALAQRPELAPIWVQLGHALKEEGDLAGAETAYRRALALDDAEADTHLQLGHLFKLRRRRVPAIAAYADAVRLDPDLAPAREALAAALGYSPPEIALALDSAAAGPTAERHRALLTEARRRVGGGLDLIWLGVIDWHYRRQRPQHLAAHLADRSARIFYVSLVFDGDEAAEPFRLIDQPHPGVFELRLRLAGDPLASVYAGLSAGAVSELRAGLAAAVDALAIATPVLVVEHPEWQSVAFGVTGARVVYDCIDLATGFANTRPSLAAAEAALLVRADLVIAASCPLIQRIEEQHPGILVRNAAEVDFFAQAAADRPSGEFPVIGYFGAIAEWFAIDWIEACAVAKPAWRFRLIGQVDNCDVSRIAALPNVEFLGEVPYCELPALLREFDVAVIPFRLTPLTRFTNPVKLYEYMAAGKAVVASPLPELAEADDLVYLADDAVAFAAAIARALSEDSPALRARRRQWARRHDWSERARQFAEALATLTEPKGPGS